MSLGKPTYKLLDGTLVDLNEIAALRPVRDTKCFKHVELKDMPDWMFGPALQGAEVCVLDIVLRSGYVIHVVSEIREDLHEQRGELTSQVFNMRGISL